MADTKITALTAITTVDPAADVLPIVDVSDTSMAASGTTKKITSNQILGAGGTATLASATITGDLTVDTNTLKVDSANDRVGVRTASPAATLSVVGSAGTGNTVAGITGNTDSGLLSIGNDNSNGLAGSQTWTGSAQSYAAAISFGQVNTTGVREQTRTHATLFSTNIQSFGRADLVIATKGSLDNNDPTEKYRIASDGVATWSNVGGVAGTAMTLNSTGLGVGDAPTADCKLTVRGGAFINRGATGGASQLLVSLAASSGGNFGQISNTGTRWALGYGSTLTTVGTEALIWDSSGNVGIGVTPSAWTTSYNALNIGSGGSIAAYKSANYDQFYVGSNFFENTSGAWRFINNGYATQYWHNSGSHVWRISTTSNAAGANQPLTWNQAMTLDASGILVVGNTAAASVGVTGGWLASPNSGNSYELIGHNSGSASGSVYSYFFYNSSQIGSITQNGTTGVLYNITSDYRLKESVQPIANGLARVNALKPSIYKWKADGSNGEGFIAHELAEVVPFAVSGEKDAVNEDGSIKPQGIDMSRVVPILVAAIQELTARVQTLETR